MITFGTDGWRALIDQEFTPKNIEKVIQAFCDWRLQQDPSPRRIILGYDCRLRSTESAQLIAQVLAGNGFRVELSQQYCPTPCVSWMVKTTDAIAGIMVTASHNPWQWNGVKFKEEYGGSASPEYTRAIEAQLKQNEANHLMIRKISFRQGLAEGLITEFDPHGAYLAQLKSLLDGEAIRAAKFKVLFDSLYGAGGGYGHALFPEQIDEIHGEADPHFGGVNPEPISPNLGRLMERMSKGNYQLGLATDGDADRIGAVDERGHFVNSHQIFALLLQHYVEDHGLRGTVVKSISTTQMINRLCTNYDLPLIETPIGFKHICKEMVARNALMGGEESGGISFIKHVHERDGLLNGLMLLNMMSLRKKSLSQLLTDLFAKIGSYYFERLDLPLKKSQIASMKDVLSSHPLKDLAGARIVEHNFSDGYKYSFEDGSWLLIRASGTEPLVRIYAESNTPEKVGHILKAGRDLMPRYL